MNRNAVIIELLSPTYCTRLAISPFNTLFTAHLQQRMGADPVIATKTSCTPGAFVFTPAQVAVLA